jgi:hypothetical protein
MAGKSIAGLRKRLSPASVAVALRLDLERVARRASVRARLHRKPERSVKFPTSDHEIASGFRLIKERWPKLALGTDQELKGRRDSQSVFSEIRRLKCF